MKKEKLREAGGVNGDRKEVVVTNEEGKKVTLPESRIYRRLLKLVLT